MTSVSIAGGIEATGEGSSGVLIDGGDIDLDGVRVEASQGEAFSRPVV